MLVCAAMVLALAVPALAQVPNEFGVLVGATRADSNLNNGDKAKWGPLLGLRFAHVLDDHYMFFVDGTASRTDVDIPGVDATKLYALRFGPEYYFGSANRANRWFVAGSMGLEKLDYEPDSATRPFISLGLGERFLVGEKNHLSWQIRADRMIGSDGVFDNDVTNWQFLLGYAFGFGGKPKDGDGDGVFDSRDKCPNTPLGATVDVKGCPKDSDGDGVFDGLDKCPDTPKGWAVDASGCPLDSDKDGVPDGADKCPNTPAGAIVDTNGCPKDSDGDGVYDGLDKCPDTPKGWPVDAKGCPKDSDNDGVPDGADKCPNSPAGAKVDATGCPLPEPKPEPAVPEPFKESRTFVLEGVNFETDKAVLLPASKVILDKVAETLTAWPDVTVEVGGHTDSRGAHAHNMALSDARAKSVRDYLVSKGVAAARMTTKGYGPDKPIGDNKTDVGRAKNRRVELTKTN